MRRGEPRRVWSAQEEALLRMLYPHRPNVEIGRRLGRSVSAVVMKGRTFGLRKSGERMSLMGRQNVKRRGR